MKIEYIPHAADIKMKIEGSSMQDLFLTGLNGMNNILKKKFCDQIHRFYCRTRIEICSSDYTNLLVNCLSDILSLSRTEKVIYCRAQFLEFSEKNIVADIFGAPIDSFDQEIKEVAYIEAHIKKNQNDKWETNIVFDI